MKIFVAASFVTLVFLANTNIFAQESKSNSSSQASIIKQNSTDEKIYSKDEVDIQAVIKKFKVHPKLLKECIIGGTVKLKIVLSKSGQVTDINFIEKNGCENVDEEKIVPSIRKLKFTPAMKGGVPVSQFIIRILQLSL